MGVMKKLLSLLMVTAFGFVIWTNSSISVIDSTNKPRVLLVKRACLLPCIVQPMDVVYTWVNGTDPRFIKSILLHQRRERSFKSSKLINIVYGFKVDSLINWQMYKLVLLIGERWGIHWGHWKSTCHGSGKFTWSPMVKFRPGWTRITQKLK